MITCIAAGKSSIICCCDANSITLNIANMETVNFVCEVCDFKASSARYLLVHSRVHKKADGISCKACDLAFETPYDRRKHQCEQKTKQCSFCNKQVVNLKVHMKNVHEDTIGFDCESCDYVGKTPRCMQVHTNRVHLKQAKTIECDICGTKLSSNQSLNIHIASQHSSNIFHCPSCEFKTKTTHHLRQHIKLQHTDRFKPMECSICKITLKNKFSLKVHMKFQHENKSIFPCTVCDKVFKYKNSLQKHMASTHKTATNDEEWLECEVCSMKFLGKNALKDHQRWRHHKERLKGTHQCAEPECSFVTDSKFKLTQHVDGIHLKLRPFKCELCGAAFKRKAHLQTHSKNVHSDDAKIFKCDKCDYASNESRWLKNHISAVHLGLRPYKCETCESTFTQKSHLNTHMKAVHLNIRQHSCNFCDSTFTTRPAKEVHEQGVHGIGDKEFRCDQCDFQTAYRDSFKRHTEMKVCEKI